MTKLDKLENQELVSDLMDGRLQGEAFTRALELVEVDGDARNAWQVNHLIGDIMRFGATGAVIADTAFVDRFRDRFEQVQRPGLLLQRTVREEMGALEGIPSFQDRDSANASSFRWKMVAGIATLAAVVAVTWGSLSDLRGGSSAQLARSDSSSPVVSGKAAADKTANLGVGGSPAAVEPQVMIRDPNLDALLAAHKQFGGTSALQMPAGFLRNATFEGPSK